MGTTTTRFPTSEPIEISTSSTEISSSSSTKTGWKYSTRRIVEESTSTSSYSSTSREIITIPSKIRASHGASTSTSNAVVHKVSTRVYESYTDTSNSSSSSSSIKA